MICRGIAVRILRWIHIHSSTHSTCIGILCLGIHALTIEVKGQVIVKERRIQVDGCGNTLEVGSLQDTLLVGITY